jgi:hypothetical protein
MTPGRIAWPRALVAALLASGVGAELLRASRDSFSLAGGSDSLARYASCGAVAQGVALAIAVVTSGVALGVPGVSRWKRAALAALGLAVLLLSANTIGYDGKDEVIVEHVGLFRIAALSRHGEAPLDCRNGAVTLAVSQDGRSALLFRGIPPWRVDTEWLFTQSVCDPARWPTR